MLINREKATCLFVLGFLLWGLTTFGQERKFEDLFQKIETQCPGMTEQYMGLIPQSGSPVSLLDSLLPIWQKACLPHEILKRTITLYNLEKGLVLPVDSSLTNQTVAYHNALDSIRYGFLAYSENYRKYFNFTQKWAAELLSKKDWEEKERLILELYSAESSSEIVKLLREREYKNSLVGQESLNELRQNLRFHAEIGLNYHLPTGMLARRWSEQLWGFDLNLLFEENKHGVGAIFEVMFPIDQQAFRVIRNELGVQAEAPYMFAFGMDYQYTFISTRTQQLSLLAGFIFNTLATDQYEQFEEGESRITILSLAVRPGLKWSFYTRKWQSAGLKIRWQPINFGADSDLLQNLNGSLWSTGLYYSF
jgi:hypothetical protein